MTKMQKRLAQARNDAVNEFAATQLFKDSRTLPFIIRSIMTGVDIPQPVTRTQFLELYKKLVWVYACALTIGQSGAGVPLHLYKKLPKGKKERVFEHPAIDLLEHPNEKMSFFDVMEAMLIYLELNGNSFMEVVYDKRRNPSELWLLRPDRIRINVTKNKKRISSFSYRVKPGDQPAKFLPKELLHFKYFSPNDDWYGQSSIEAGTDPIVLEQYTNTYNQNFFKNGATPSGILIADEYLSKKEIKRIQRQWKTRNEGPNSAGKTPVLPKGLKYEPIGAKQSDMEFLALKKMTRTEIFALFGVPPVKVGILEGAKHSNYGLQETMFYKDTIAPKLKKVSGALNTMFLPLFEADKNLYFEFDMTTFISGDPSKIIERLVKQIQSGMMSPNEAREKIGLETFEGGDRYFVASHLIQISGTGGRPTADSGEEEPVNIDSRPTDGGNLQKIKKAIKDKVLKRMRKKNGKTRKANKNHSG